MFELAEQLAQVSHLIHAMLAKTHTPMYLMHKYWARKPHNVVHEYIEHYSKEGDIVLDPFCGSGVTAIEAIKANRKGIAIDLDPVATFITRTTAMPVDLKGFSEEFRKIEQAIKSKIDSLYASTCSKCRKQVICEATIWNTGLPIDMRYSCVCTKGTQWKKPSRTDVEKIRETEGKKLLHWYPDNELVWNSRINVRKGTKVSDLFTKRNLFALSMILEEITKVKNKDLRELLEFTFTSSLGQASKMVFVYRKKGRDKEVGGWATRGYWVPKEYFEINAWNCFEERYNKVFRGKEDSNSVVRQFSSAKNFEDLKKGKANFLARTLSALDLTKLIPDSSIDYIFTDPPYGDSVPYLELDYMWSSWLKFDVSFSDEIVISDSPVRKEKKFEMYYKMMRVAFNEM